MVVVPEDSHPSSSSSVEVESSPSSPDVQFTPTRCGLPGGDIQLSRSSSSLDAEKVQEGSSAPSNEEQSETAERSSVTPSYLPITLPSGEDSRQAPLDENGHKYVGLINQAMTCYLNSLVQSLYMTPEFRNAIYRWEYRSSAKAGSTGDREARSIPYQIQKLFLLLQTSELGCLETKDLTASFGWSSNEAYDQHDVQELCRLMFDALELKWKGTQNERLIQNLYRGKLQDFVKCLKCGKESLRLDVFLDLPLAVKPFGAVEAFHSVAFSITELNAAHAYLVDRMLKDPHPFPLHLCYASNSLHTQCKHPQRLCGLIEEALQAFVTPELLYGSNQYFCEKCNSKQDAHKGLRITDFPYLLTIQLKRFDFDYNTMHRIKLNDRMTFPDVLDLNPFVHVSKATVAELSNDVPPPFASKSEVVSAGLPLDRAYVNKLLKRGEYVYELFSVMVHQGSAAGGHYFAHIKNMDQGQWYCFNDTRVERVGSEEITKSFGGSYGGWSTSNTNAYMLMYRKISKQNSSFIRTPDLPLHITQLKSQWKQQEEERERQRIYQLSLVNIKVHLNMVCDNELLLSDPYIVDMPRSQDLCSVYNQALKFFEDKCRNYSNVDGGSISFRHHSRLLRASSERGLIIYEAYVSRADLAKKIESCVTDARPNSVTFLFDVWRPRGIPFPVAPSNGRTIRVARIDIAARVVNPFFYVYVSPDLRSVIQVKQLIGSMFGDGQRAAVASRLILERDLLSNGLVLLDSPATNFFDLLQQCFSGVPLVYCDGGSKGESVSVVEEDRKKPLNHSTMFAILDRKKFAQLLLVELPPEEEILRSQAAKKTYSTFAWKNVAIAEQSVAPESSIEESASAEGLPPASEELSSTDSLSATPLSSINSSDSEIDRSIIELSSAFENLLRLDVDSRISFGRFKSWLGKKLSIEPTQFVIIKHYREDDKGYECSCKDDETLRGAFENVFKLSIKLRPPLRDDEKLIRVVHFNLEESNRENWRTLFECPASRQCSVEDFLLQCIHLYSEIYGDRLSLNQVRLRDMSTFNRPMKAVLNLSDTLDSRGSQWSNTVYFQIISDERLVGKPGVPVLVRRFRPSTVEVSSIHEALVDPQATSQMDSLAQSVSSLSGIPIERLAFTEVGSSWEKWPFALNRLAMLDGTVKFHGKPSYAPNDVLERVGGRIVYYRDTAEVAKELSTEDRKQIQIKENGQSITAATRRKERPLRIQMSSISDA